LAGGVKVVRDDC